MLTGFGDESGFISEILRVFRPRMADAAEFASLNRVLVVETASGVPIDISFGALPFEDEMIKRTKRITVLPGVNAPVATAEDIVIMKSIAGRPQDVKDIEGILAGQSERLDLDYIRYWLGDLAELWIEKDLLGEFDAIERSVRTRLGNASSRRSSSN